MPHNGITYSSPSQEEKSTYTAPKTNLPTPFPQSSGYEHSQGYAQEEHSAEEEEPARTFTPTGTPQFTSNDDFKQNPVALAPSLDDSEEDDGTGSHGNTKSSFHDHTEAVFPGNTQSGSHDNTKPKVREDEEVTYTYSQEPIRFEYVSHSADDDGFEELIKKLQEDNEEGGHGDQLEEVYKPPKSSGSPLYESARTFEGFDQGSPSIDLKIDTKSGLSKSFIAPIFELPSSYDSSFDRHTPPVKYQLKKKPKYTAPILSDQDIHDIHDLGDHHDEDTHGHHGFDKGDGSSYDSAHHAEHGHNHDKGFKDYTEYDSKDKTKYGKEEDKGFYNGKDGYKKHHYNEGDKYGEHHNKKKGVKGGKFGSSGYHKKGHKTNGYHNIFHKDEFKKEHKFYDDAKKEGFFDKYGNYHKKHGTHGGGKHGGGFHESGYDASHAGKDGIYDKGFSTQEHKGHDGKSGHSSGFANFGDVDKKYGHDEEKKYGYGESHH